MLVTMKWSIKDYHHLVASGVLHGRRVELIGGDIVEMAPEGEAHAYCSDEAGEYLLTLLGTRAKVRQAKPISLPQIDSEPEPDIAVVQRLGREYGQHHPYPENIFWVIEYSNTSLEKDLQVKARLYAAAGIPEYWVANLRSRALTVLRSPTAADGYTSQQTLMTGTIAPLAFPDVAIAIARLLPE